MSILSQIQPSGKPKVGGDFSPVEDPQTHTVQQGAESVSSRGTPVAPEGRVEPGSLFAPSMGAKRVNRPNLIQSLSYDDPSSVHKLGKLDGQIRLGLPVSRPVLSTGRLGLDPAYTQNSDTDDYSWLADLPEAEFEKEAASLNDEAWLQKTFERIDACGRRAMLCEFSKCRQHILLPVLCHKIGCSTCTVIEAKRRRKFYGPALDRLVLEAKKARKSGLGVRLKFITLTVRNFPLDEGREMVNLLKSSLGRLKDRRFGPRVLEKLEVKFFLAVLRKSRKSEKNPRPLTHARVQRQFKLWREFKQFFLSKHKEGRKDLKFRHYSRGIVRIEWTPGKVGGHHFHLHMLWSSEFPIPQVLLELLWERATQGDQVRVDIRRVRGDIRKELLKYITKPWQMTPDQRGAVLLAMRNQKSVWGWGLEGYLPEAEDRSVHHCSDPNCKMKTWGACQLDYRLTPGRISALRHGWVLWGTYRDSQSKSIYRVRIFYAERGGLVWFVNSG